MYYLLVTSKELPYTFYNIYCDVVDDTTGVHTTINECLTNMDRIQAKEWYSLQAFCEKYESIVICSFSSPADLRTRYPELFI